jgi:hypothetical protein
MRCKTRKAQSAGKNDNNLTFATSVHGSCEEVKKRGTSLAFKWSVLTAFLLIISGQ